MKRAFRNKFFWLIAATLLIIWISRFEFDHRSMSKVLAPKSETCEHIARLVELLQDRLPLNSSKDVLANQDVRDSEQITTARKKENGAQLSQNWITRRTCTKPEFNIAFLKMHKCASTTIQNILMRYGEKHNLTFAMPAKSHIFTLRKPFEASFVHENAPFHTDLVNIFTMHTKWNKKEVSKILYPGAVYFTIVREPKSVFLSLYDYFAFTTYYGMNVSEFILKHDIETARFMGCLSYNVMACDFGAIPGDYSNHQTIVDLTRQMDEEFDFVMVAERMEESLVLLAHLLCWSYDDVVAVRSNARHTKQAALSPEVDSVLSQRLAPDFHIYNHFTKKFDELVSAFGKDRMAVEVRKLRKATDAKLSSCKIERTKRKSTNEHEEAGSSKVEKLDAKFTDPDCKALVREEQNFVNLLKRKQAELLRNL